MEYPAQAIAAKEETAMGAVVMVFLQDERKATLDLVAKNMGLELVVVEGWVMVLVDLMKVTRERLQEVSVHREIMVVKHRQGLEEAAVLRSQALAALEDLVAAAWEQLVVAVEVEAEVEAWPDLVDISCQL